MDRLTIFPQPEAEVTIAGDTSLSDVGEQLENISEELKLTRKGHEMGTWGEEVVEMEDYEEGDEE